MTPCRRPKAKSCGRPSAEATWASQTFDPPSCIARTGWLGGDGCWSAASGVTVATPAGTPEGTPINTASLSRPREPGVSLESKRPGIARVARAEGGIDSGDSLLPAWFPDCLQHDLEARDILLLDVVETLGRREIEIRVGDTDAVPEPLESIAPSSVLDDTRSAGPAARSVDDIPMDEHRVQGAEGGVPVLLGSSGGALVYAFEGPPGEYSGPCMAFTVPKPAGMEHDLGR